MENQKPPSGDSQTAATRRKKDRHRAVPLLPEVRYRPLDMANVEVRSADQTDEIVITGTPIVYDTPYTVTDMFGDFEERMMPGVASDVLAKSADVRFLFNHDGLPLARTVAGTMSIQDTATEMRFRAVLDARQQLANDLAIAIQRGDVSQMSVGFIVDQDEWNEDWDQRSVVRFSDFLDVSAVTYPCSPTTSVEIAQRMALAMPVQSRARVRKAYQETREGRPLREAYETVLRSMLSVDVDPGDDTRTPTGTGRLGSPDGNGKTYADIGTGNDGSVGGGIAQEGAGGYADASGMRSERPTEAEYRTQVESLGDSQRTVYEALLAKFSRTDERDLYPLDIGRDWIVWRSYGGSLGVFHLPFTVDDAGGVTFRGEPRQVAQAEAEAADADQPSQTSRAKALQLRAKALRASLGDV